MSPGNVDREDLDVGGPCVIVYVCVCVMYVYTNVLCMYIRMCYVCIYEC